jgi:hypothetical protein
MGTSSLQVAYSSNLKYKLQWQVAGSFETNALPNLNHHDSHLTLPPEMDSMTLRKRLHEMSMVNIA